MASLKEYQSLSAPPSVSTEQWKKHALKKMSSGFLLIISDTRNLARFYKGNGALENCSYRTAMRLLRQGYLEEVGMHITGTLYQLSEFHRDRLALASITQSQMGAVLLVEEDDYDEESDTIGYDFDDGLSDESLSSDEANSDQNQIVA